MSGLRSLMREAQREARKGQERQRQLENRAIKAAIAARQRKQQARHEGYAADIIKQREANKPRQRELALSEKMWKADRPWKMKAALDRANTPRSFGYAPVVEKEYEDGSVQNARTRILDRTTGRFTDEVDNTKSWKNYATPNPTGGIPMTSGGAPMAPINPAGEGGGFFRLDMLPARKPQPAVPRMEISSKKKPTEGRW